MQKNSGIMGKLMGRGLEGERERESERINRGKDRGRMSAGWRQSGRRLEEREAGRKDE